jgi:thiol-disulfide isomerase/thioredoxin
MNFEIFVRLGFALIIICVGYAAYTTTNRVLLRRRSQRAFGLDAVRPGLPVLLYFTTPDCVPCRTVQRPAIERVRETTGRGLQIVEVDATQRPDLASQWGVLTVPTTFLIDARGEARYVNHGVTRFEKLMQQIRAI